MIPDKFNMVDMGGIDLIMMQGESVPGLYEKLMAALSNCQYQCLYNWLFDGVLIPPAFLNEGVSVTTDDVIHVYSVEPGPVDPEIIPLLAEENGVYNVPVGKDGFNPVTVDVPSYTPVINPIAITENGTYNAPSGVDGYSPVTVDVPSSTPVINPITITENGTYTAPYGVDGYSPITVNVSGGGDNWQELKNYIESSGTQYIDTGYAASDNTVLELIIALSTSLTQYAALFGARNGTYNTATKAIIAYRENANMTFFAGPGQAKGSITYTPYLNVKSKWTLSKTKCGVSDQYGVNYYGFSINGGSLDDVNNIYLLSFNENGADLGAVTRCSGKVYRFRIFEGETLVHEFIPWQENGVACLKDTVTSNLKYNAGTGVFVYGTDQ